MVGTLAFDVVAGFAVVVGIVAFFVDSAVETVDGLEAVKLVVVFGIVFVVVVVGVSMGF